MPKGRKADRKMVEQKKPKMFESSDSYAVPKIKLKKGGVNYKEGDRIHISYTDGDYTGTIMNILSSQIVVRPDGCDNPGCDMFFFTTGIKLKKC